MEENAVVHALDLAVLCVFAVEIVLKVVAEGPRPWRYFSGEERAWNWCVPRAEPAAAITTAPDPARAAATASTSQSSCCASLCGARHSAAARSHCCD